MRRYYKLQHFKRLSKYKDIYNITLDTIKSDFLISYSKAKTFVSVKIEHPDNEEFLRRSDSLHRVAKKTCNLFIKPSPKTGHSKIVPSEDGLSKDRFCFVYSKNYTCLATGENAID